MILFKVSCFLSVMLLCLSSLLYVIRLREIKLNSIGYLKKLALVLRVIIFPFSLLLLTVLAINTNLFRFTSLSSAISPVVSLSMIFIISSIALFIYSFQLTPKYIIELDKPSRLKSRTGTIRLGKIIAKSRTKGKFYLNISDLAQS